MEEDAVLLPNADDIAKARAALKRLAASELPDHEWLALARMTDAAEIALELVDMIRSGDDYRVPIDGPKE